MKVHTYDDSHGAYDNTQCDDNVSDGDVVVVPSEGIAGFLFQAWPVAVTVAHGQLHGITPGALASDDWKPYLESVAKAEKIAQQNGWELDAAIHGGGATLTGRATTIHTVGAPVGLTCILPGCRNSVNDQGVPCSECMAEFGSHLRATDGPPMTAEAQADRDRETQHSYALQMAGTNPALIAAAGAHYGSPPAASAETRERKANQRCWLCEERRTCTKAERGWECDTCLDVH
jgi:hypothetical protein